MKILIVEDEMSIALEIEMLIDELEHQLIGIVDNSEEALALVLKNTPNLVLMDIGIDGKYSGLEVAEKIKHLPVAVLFISSYNSQEMFERAKLTNFVGYLTKPINRISIQGAIEMAYKYLNDKNHLLSDTQQIATNLADNDLSKEDIFISRFKNIIFENLANSDLSVSGIARKMGISRMQLHRKITGLVNQPPSDFIKTIRLEMAYKLLKEQELNISEIAYQTGFSTPFHFSRVFKNKYGIPPSKVKKIK